MNNLWIWTKCMRVWCHHPIKGRRLDSNALKILKQRNGIVAYRKQSHIQILNEVKIDFLAGIDLKAIPYLLCVRCTIGNRDLTESIQDRIPCSPATGPPSTLFTGVARGGFYCNMKTTRLCYTSVTMQPSAWKENKYDRHWWFRINQSTKIHKQPNISRQFWTDHGIMFHVKQNPRAKTMRSCEIIVSRGTMIGASIRKVKEWRHDINC